MLIISIHFLLATTKCDHLSLSLSIYPSIYADVCNNTDLPELEIISLLEEQLPVYKLRADTIYGYEQDDWLHTPLVAPDAALDLTTEQIEETLKYFCRFLLQISQSNIDSCLPEIGGLLPFSLISSHFI